MINKDHSSRVLMIALDGAEPRLVEQWMSEGLLPNLKRLNSKGAYGRLQSSADWLAGSPWPTFYTGTMPSEHGLYHYLQWRADYMTLAKPAPEWIAPIPFWRRLDKMRRRVISLDVPMTLPADPFEGIEITGWATHDRLAPPASHPPKIIGWINQEFGQPTLSNEFFEQQPVSTLLRARDEIIQNTHHVSKVAEALMKKEDWDLFIVGFGAPHRGGHQLWDLSGTIGETEPKEVKDFSNALREVYVSCDTAVGRLLDTAGNDVTVFVFSLHGMGANTSRVRLLPTMLNRVLGKEEKPSEKSKHINYLEKLFGFFPLKWRHAIKHRLSKAFQEQLTTFFRMGKVNWNATKAFCLEADLQGYIRINLRGREASGIVEPKREYNELCEKIIEGLNTFVDMETKEPVVESIIRSDLHFANGSRREYLPDLLVRWNSSPAAKHQAVVSALYGSITWPIPGRNVDGRSGNHRPHGFILASGKAIMSGSRITNAHILDIAPTVYSLLGLPQPPEMCGRTIVAR
jgi:predicted AlkP superfamily phosphohydrolase/phosphomutase